MSSNIYVGNLSFNVPEADLSAQFAQFGTVSSCKIITDRDSGRSKGFAFVEMSSTEEAQTAIGKMNGMELDGRTLNVNEAKEKNNGGGDFKRNHNRW